MSLLSPDGIKPINTITELITQEYQHQQCGSNFGVESTGAIAASLISKLKTLRFYISVGLKQNGLFNNY